MDPAEQNDAGPSVSSTGCGTYLLTCYATFKMGWFACWQNAKINQNVGNFVHKLFKNCLVGSRIVCYLLSISLWISGSIIATKDYHKHYNKNQALIPSEELSHVLLVVVILAPLVVEVPMFLTLLCQLHRTKLEDIHGGGPVLLRTCWTVPITLFGFLISISFVVCSPRWIGGALILAVILVLGSTLFEIATALSPNTKLVPVSAGFSCLFSGIVAHDSKVSSHRYLAYAFVGIAFFELLVSYFLHWKIEKRLKSLSEQGGAAENA